MKPYLYVVLGFSAGYGLVAPLAVSFPDLSLLATCFVRVWLALGVFGLFGLPALAAPLLFPKQAPLDRSPRVALAISACVGAFLVYYVGVAWYWPGMGDLGNGRSCFFHVPAPLLALLRWCSMLIVVPLEALVRPLFQNPRGVPVLLYEYLQSKFDPHYRWFHVWLAGFGFVSWCLAIAIAVGIARVVRRRPPSHLSGTAA